MFVRRELRDLSGEPIALALEGDLDRDAPAIAVQAGAGSVRVSIDGAPLLWARTASHGFEWVPRFEPAPRLFAPIEARDARVMDAKDDALAWPRRMGETLAPLLLSRRTPVAWLAMKRWTQRAHEELVPFAPGESEWNGTPSGLRLWPEVRDDRVLPLRPWPTEDDARVKALRKLAREGTLPPAVLLWMSGLQCWLLLDGHARCVAARAEGVALDAVVAVRPTAQARSFDEERRARLESAQRSLEALASSPHATAEANRIALELHESIDWLAIDRASPLDEEALEEERASEEAKWRSR